MSETKGRVRVVPPTQKSRAGTVSRISAEAKTIDLDVEVVRNSRGRRITEADAERLAEQVLARVGRPSLTGAGQKSPAVSFRVSARTRELAEAKAAAEGKTVSQVAREALERYVGGA